MSRRRAPSSDGHLLRHAGNEGRLRFEPLESRLLLAAVEWFDLSGWDFGQITASGQSFADAAENMSLDVSVDSGSFSACNSGCAAFETGVVTLRQTADRGALRFAANTRSRFVLEVEALDTAEQVGVFTRAVDSLNVQTSGAPVNADHQVFYGSGSELLQGIRVRGTGDGPHAVTGAADVQLVTAPATDLILEYEGLAAQMKYGKFRVGHLVETTLNVDWFDFSTTADPDGTFRQRRRFGGPCKYAGHH